jgi:5-methylcytosine-specific restriction endonuclease McrA
MIEMDSADDTNDLLGRLAAYFADEKVLARWLRDAIYAIGAQSVLQAYETRSVEQHKYITFHASKSDLVWFQKKSGLYAGIRPVFVAGSGQSSASAYSSNGFSWHGMSGEENPLDLECVYSPNYIYASSGITPDIKRITEYVNSVNAFALSIFSGLLTVRRSFCKCDNPIHFFPLFAKGYSKNWWKQEQTIDTEERYDFCELKGDKYFCEQCVEYYENHWPEMIAAQKGESVGLAQSERDRRANERAKVTKSVRWNVLARDGFKCRVCGRSQLNGDQVILHVDHIKPIAKGGKSIMDNLQTLCIDCNLGKSDSESMQEFLFDDGSEPAP